MEKSTLAILVTVAFSVVGVLGDYFLKRASECEQPLRTGSLVLKYDRSTCLGVRVSVSVELPTGDPVGYNRRTIYKESTMVKQGQLV